MATGGNRICSVVACIGDTMETCGKRFSSYQENTTGIFEELSITAIMPTPQRVIELDGEELLKETVFDGTRREDIADASYRLLLLNSKEVMGDFY
ncbi:hypothetical protein RR48_10004 [Papilio machaon]|uniref:Vanin C-terminal domain-containing protein n=1 Tax=Papilio machaon TaxID=76193 RepID=A0A194RDN9_PAPMA|nr:hypothetical protein RR48_10004 [Papilio machaon]